MATEQKECESCHEKVEKTRSFKRFDDLCDKCYVKESTAFINTSIQQQVIIPQQQPDITKREEFFNAEVEAINQIAGTAFERAQKVRERINAWRMILFEAQSKEYKAYQYLQELARELSKEEKEKLQIQDVSYTPSVVASKPKASKDKITERLSKEDKSLLQMATMIYGAKMNKLDDVNKQCFKEHPDWWNNGEVIFGKKAEYNQYVLDHGALTKAQAIERIKDNVRAGKATQFQQLATGERALSDPIVADSDSVKPIVEPVKVESVVEKPKCTEEFHAKWRGVLPLCMKCGDKL